MNAVKDAQRQFLYSEIGLSLTAERAMLVEAAANDRVLKGRSQQMPRGEL